MDLPKTKFVELSPKLWFPSTKLLSSINPFMADSPLSFKLRQYSKTSL